MSYTLFSLVERKARIPHRCIWCGRMILGSEKYLDERSVYDGSIQRQRWHPECHAAGSEHFRSGEDEFTPYENERPCAAPAISN